MGGIGWEVAGEGDGDGLGVGRKGSMPAPNGGGAVATFLSGLGLPTALSLPYPVGPLVSFLGCGGESNAGEAGDRAEGGGSALILPRAGPLGP